MSYIGEHLGRLRHGEGVYSFPGSSFKYSGNWNLGLIDGEGTLTLPDGSTYQGTFEKGEISGNGIRMWADGAQYTGSFFRGERHGHGVFVRPEGEVFDGEWRNNQYWGNGLLKTSSGAIYVGAFQKHKFHGVGRFEDCRIKESYEGEWSKGKKHGVGKWIGSAGETYEGSWADDSRSGEGCAIYPSHQMTYQGRWIHNSPSVLAKEIVCSFPLPASLEEDKSRATPQALTLQPGDDFPDITVQLSSGEERSSKFLAPGAIHKDSNALNTKVDEFVTGESGRVLLVKIQRLPDDTQPSKPLKGKVIEKSKRDLLSPSVGTDIEFYVRKVDNRTAARQRQDPECLQDISVVAQSSAAIDTAGRSANQPSLLKKDASKKLKAEEEVVEVLKKDLADAEKVNEHKVILRNGKFLLDCLVVDPLTPPGEYKFVFTDLSGGVFGEKLPPNESLRLTILNARS